MNDVEIFAARKAPKNAAGIDRDNVTVIADVMEETTRDGITGTATKARLVILPHTQADKECQMPTPALMGTLAMDHPRQQLLSGPIRHSHAWRPPHHWNQIAISHRSINSLQTHPQQRRRESVDYSPKDAATMVSLVSLPMFLITQPRETLECRRHAKEDLRREANGKGKEARAEIRRDENGMTKTSESSTDWIDDLTPENSEPDAPAKHKDKHKLKVRRQRRDRLKLKGQRRVKDKHTRRVNRKRRMKPPRQYSRRRRAQRPHRQRRLKAPRSNCRRPRKVCRHRHLPRRSTNVLSQPTANLLDNSCPGSAATIRLEKDQDQGRRDLATFGQKGNARNHALEIANIARLPAKKMKPNAYGKTTSEGKDGNPINHHPKDMVRRSSAGEKTDSHRKARAKDDSSGKARAKAKPKDKR